MSEILLYESIGHDPMTGTGISAKMFAELLDQHQAEELTVRINSNGGSVFDGIAMMNMLAKRPNVSVYVDGIAASIASIIAMGASEGKLYAASNSFLMVHNGQGITLGNKEAHKKTIETLEHIDKLMAQTYAKRTGKRVETFAKYMDAETWFTAEEAKDIGLIDKIIDPRKVTNKVDLSMFNNVPVALSGTDYSEKLELMRKYTYLKAKE